MPNPRNIILLSDGTGNSRGKLQQTNVWRTYEAIDLKDPPDPPQPRQFAYYDDGVGTSSFKPLAILGGALGYGLARNVRDLYEFLCRTYREGDTIYAFGFSRGAFTIRVLLGLINNQGLVPYRGDESELRRWSKAAFRAYRRERYKLAVNWIALPRMLRDAAIDGWARLRGHQRYGTVDRKKVTIHFVGVWDTVAAYGMPIDELAIFINAVVWPLDLPGMKLSENVSRAVHALALDDERNTFHPKLWEPEPRIKQVWFAGMHSDVGGGYADKGMAHVSLHWMLCEAEAAGLRLQPSVRKQQDALADENGPMNDSRSGIAGYYRYRPRELPPGSLVHGSVLRRIQVGQDAYAPIVLPPEFAVMDLDGTVRPASEALSGFSGTDYQAGRDGAWNGVWLRRGIYFFTVAVTLALLLLPMVSKEDGEACSTDSCWLSPAIRGLKVLLPSSLEGWAAWYAANPGWFVLLGGLTLAGLVVGGLVQRWIFDRMRRVWYGIPQLRPSSVAVGHPLPAGSSAMGRAFARFRLSGAYQAVIRSLRRQILPAISGAALITVALMLATTLAFNVRSSAGHFCDGAAHVAEVGPASPVLPFVNNRACAATGLRLHAGGTYEIELAIQGSEAWLDDTLAADLRGIVDPPLRHKLALLLKRELSQPIFMPLARIGKEGSDVYPLTPDPSQPREAPRNALSTRIVARTTGELFLYLNDAAGPPWDPFLFYRNNHGTAKVTVRMVVPPQR